MTDKMTDIRAKRKGTRRMYKFGYADLGKTVGSNGVACRRWLKSRGLSLAKGEPIENLKAAAYYIQKMTGGLNGSGITLVAKPKPDQKLHMKNGASVTLKDYGGAKIEGQPVIATSDDTAVDPIAELERNKDRYQELFMQGAQHGDYDDYTEDERKEMTDLTTWLAGKGVRV